MAPSHLSAYEALIEIDQLILNALPVAICICAANGAIVRFNSRAAQLWGWTPGADDTEAWFSGAFRLFRPDGRPLPPEETPMALALRSGEPQREREVIFERPDGSRVVALVNIDLLRGSAGEIEGAINCFQDITDRARAEYELGVSRAALRESEVQHRALIDALPAAIYTTDAAGRITYYNEAAAELWGQRPELGESEWCGSWKLYTPDGTPMPHEECPMAVALRERRPVRGLEAITERPDGSRVPFRPYPTPLFDSSGELTGAVNMLIDLCEHKLAEQMRRQLASIVEFSDDAIVSKDLNGIIISWNKGAERLFGYAAREVVGKSITIVIPQDRQHEEVEILSRLRRGEHIDHYETIRRRKDGKLVDISLTISPVKDADGRVVGASKIARDITERKRSETQRDLMIAELNHRVKNTLATVISIARQSFPKHPEVEEALHAFDARIRALAQTHGRLAETNWSGVSFNTMVFDELAPYCRQDSANVSMSGPPVSLSPRCALTLGMVIHELATNAAKYGALSVAAGMVDLSWRVDFAAGQLRIDWMESGGPKVVPPKRTGFGRRLIERALSSDLGSQVRMDFAEDGLKCWMAVPIRHVMVEDMFALPTYAPN
jgi:PAS domain S-box-containing protein